MYKKRLILLIICCISMSLQAQLNIIPSRDSREGFSGEHITYFLPLTELHFRVEVRKETVYPGRFAEFADELLGIKDVPVKVSTSYSLGNISLTNSTEADLRHQYILTRPEDSRKSVPDVAVLDENGILVYFGSSSNMTRADLAHDHPHMGASGWAFLGRDKQNHPLNVTKEVNDTVYKTITREDTSIRIPEVIERSARKDEGELAAEIAEKYFQLEDSRYRLLTGYQEVPYSGETMKYMDNALLQAMKDYLFLFTGRKQVQTRAYYFTYRPDSEDDSLWVPLFRFSEREGVSGLDDGRGDVVFLRCKSQKILEPRNAKLIEQIEEQEPKPNLLWFRTPALSYIELRDDRETIFSGSVHISQLGILRSVPYEKLSLEFDPRSGQVVRVVFNN